jgi:predicted deacylase
MSGAVILVHMANPPAFYERRIYYNSDGKNLNASTPGKPQAARPSASPTRSRAR